MNIERARRASLKGFVSGKQNPDWTKDMETLLLEMRSDGIPFSFCAEVITGESGVQRTKNACVARFHKMKAKS